MKRGVLSICFLTITLFVLAQSVPRLTERADALYEAGRFLEAIEFYDKISGLAKEDYRAKYRLGSSYLEALMYQEAENTFKELGQIVNPANEYRAKALYKYATILKTDYLFKEADSLFAYIISISADQELIKLSRKQKEGCVLALRQDEASKGFSVEFMEGINSDFYEFGATINPSNNQLVFATTQNLGGIQYQGSQFKGVLPDLVSYEWNGNRWRNNSNDQRFNRLNTVWFEGPGSFSSDRKSFYFSSCKGESGSGCKIMVSNLENGRWSEPQPLNDYINEEGSENKQPYVSVTGDTLFFSSNRSGGYGGSDIWMSLRGIEPDSWSPAINLGDVINSSEDDITPYYSSAFNCLIFASNGHVGYGGYDLYAAKGESFFEPELYNLSAPFNSPLDDAYFTISDSLGFISSNRKDRQALNIYSFPVKNERLFLSLLISGESLIDGQVISRFRDIRSLDLFAFRVEDYQGYELFAPEKRIKPKPSFIAESEAEEQALSQTVIPIQDPDTPTNSNVTVRLGAVDIVESDNSVASPGPEEVTYYAETISGRAPYSLDYEHVYFSFNSSELAPHAKRALKDLVEQLDKVQLTSIEVLAYTDIIGSNSYNQQLSKQRGEAIKSYLASLGVNANAIQVRPRGEGPLSSRTSWYSKMFSRRAEIIVNANAPIRIDQVKSYAVRYENKIPEVEKQLGVSPGQLEKWNSLESDTIKAGSIIRIPSRLGLIPQIKYFLEEDDLRNSFFIYKVKPNETLSSIARKYNTIEELIAEVNHLDGELKAGDEIFIYRIK